MLDFDAALERVLGEGDEWQSWRALRLAGDDPGPVPEVAGQHPSGGFTGPGGRLSPGITGESLCGLVVVGLRRSQAATRAAGWLEGARTPAQAWLDAPDEVPGPLDTVAGARVWATASAACALLAVGRDPGHRAIDLLRGEADQSGRFTGGGFPTFAAAGAYWLAEGPTTEMAEWALRWAREENDEWDAPHRVTALTFWAAAGVPPEHASVESFVEALRAEPEPRGWADTETTLRALELIEHLGV